MKRNRVHPAHVTSNGFYPSWGKKWNIECGECSHVWTLRIPVTGDASALCPCCDARNVWSVAVFARIHDERIADITADIEKEKEERAAEVHRLHLIPGLLAIEWKGSFFRTE